GQHGAPHGAANYTARERSWKGHQKEEGSRSLHQKVREENKKGASSKARGVPSRAIPEGELTERCRGDAAGWRSELEKEPSRQIEPFTRTEQRRGGGAGQ
ncbi:hypothetical protein GOP47_0022268, partial [Adiantum capillus-veneris]